MKFFVKSYIIFLFFSLLYNGLSLLSHKKIAKFERNYCSMGDDIKLVNKKQLAKCIIREYSTFFDPFEKKYYDENVEFR